MSERDQVPTRETLDAYVDGELSPEETTRIAALLANHPESQAYVDRQLVLRRKLVDAFAPLMAERIPERLLSAAYAAAPPSLWTRTVSSLGLGGSNAFSWRAGALIAASLVIGLGIGIALNLPAPDRLLQSSPSGQVLARGDLAHALNEQLASEGQSGARAQIGLSFRNKAGQDCRTFGWSSGEASANGVGADTSGVACRAETGWVVAALTTTVAPDRATYHMAGSEMPDAIRAAVMGMISGSPYDAAEERAEKARHWQGSR